MISGVIKVFFQLGASCLVRLSSYLIVVFNRRSFVHYTLALGKQKGTGKQKRTRLVVLSRCFFAIVAIVTIVPK